MIHCVSVSDMAVQDVIESMPAKLPSIDRCFVSTSATKLILDRATKASGKCCEKH